MAKRLLATIAVAILASNNCVMAQSASELAAEEAALRHKALMRAHRKRIIETGRNDHAPTPEEYSPELELYKQARPVDKANQASTSRLGAGNGNSSASGSSSASANAGNGEQQVELRTDIKLETEKPGPGHPVGTEQFVSKRMHSETSASVPMLTEGSAQPINFKPYMAELSRKIKQNWTPPARHEQAVVSVNFILMPDGNVANLKITKHGSATADEAARHAILRAAPFAHLPNGCNVPKQIDYDFSHSSHTDEPSFQWGIH